MPQPVVDLITLKYDMERRRTAVERLDRVRAALRTEEARREQLAAQLRLEQEDVERLEGMSFASFVATLRGLREERLRMEREEYVRAKLGYDTCEEAIRALTAQMTELEREIESLQGADERYAAALSGREEHLLASDASTRRRLLPLVEELGTLRAAARELDEAEAAAHAADAALSHVATLLKKAEAWGTWDLMGGGMIATAIKHDRIEKARGAAQHAGQALQRLGMELSEARIEAVELTVDLGDFMGFADFWLDGMIADWFVQDRIEQAARRVADAHSAVRTLRERVKADQVSVRARTEEVEAERRRWLEAPSTATDSTNG